MHTKLFVNKSQLEVASDQELAKERLAKSLHEILIESEKDSVSNRESLLLEGTFESEMSSQRGSSRIRMAKKKRVHSHIYLAYLNNNYLREEEKTRTVCIKILDVLYLGKVRQLVYMQDITKLLTARNKEKMLQKFNFANEWVISRLKAPQ